MRFRSMQRRAAKLALNPQCGPGKILLPVLAQLLGTALDEMRDFRWVVADVGSVSDNVLYDFALDRGPDFGQRFIADDHRRPMVRCSCLQLSPGGFAFEFGWRQTHNVPSLVTTWFG